MSLRVLNIFYKYSNSNRTPHKIEIPLKNPAHPELTEKSITFGNHLRHRRLELGLDRKDVAVQIGVTTSTIWSWEHGRSIDKRFVKQPVNFLGYDPELNAKH